MVNETAALMDQRQTRQAGAGRADNQQWTDCGRDGREHHERGTDHQRETDSARST